MNITPGYYISPSQDRTHSATMYAHFGVCFILNCIAFYCLLRKTPEYMLSVRFYLLQIQTATMLTDLICDVLVQMVVIPPAAAVYCMGVLCREGISVNVPMALFTVCGGVVATRVTMCFVFKHQTVVPDTSLFKLNKTLYKLMDYGLWISYPLLFMMIILFTLSNEESDLNMDTWIRDRGSYVVAGQTTFTRVIGALFALGITDAFFVNTNIIVWHIYYTLNRMNAKSIATRKTIKRSVFVLHVQLMVPTIFLNIPTIVSSIAIVADIGNIELDQLPTHLLLLHSPMHSIILLAITPAYRTFIRSCFCNILGKQTPATSVASVTSTFTRSSNTRS